MKNKVYVKIKGLHTAMAPSDDEEQDEALEVINVGNYKVVNGKEYIKYDDIIEGESEVCSNLIKIEKDWVEVTKKGAVVAHLSFRKGEKTMTAYETPFGNLYLGIFARDIDIKHTEDEIKVHIEYSMELNYEMISDCAVDIEISSTGKFEL
ncbi:MAG: DUF1934 domain-containing protein [Lachnospira sp.]|nr:DUF1934 domain-containing protein [Lachnospira sp.]